MSEAIKRLAALVKGAQRIVFFGGAGVSTESGIPDFRSASGLYFLRTPVVPETILSHDFFMRRPADFFAFYREHMLYPDAAPNAAHTVLAKWEARGRLSAVVTQNIDGLHQIAGSRQVFELHGSIHRNYCMRCRSAFPVTVVAHSKVIPYCPCGGTIKPDVVLYGEGLDADVMARSLKAIRQSDLLIIGGTSLQVYPAASLAQAFEGSTVIINMSPTAADNQAQLTISAPIAQTLSAVDELLI